MTLGVLYNFGKKGITFSDEFFDAIKAMGKTGKFSV